MVKTLPSNLVAVLKKATCTAGTLRAEAHTAPARVAVVDTSSWTCSHSFTGQSRAVLQWLHSRPFR